MKTYKQFVDESITTEATIDEGLIFGIAVERKLKSALKKLQATDDTNEKIDILMKSLHFSIGSMAMNLNKSRRH